MIKQNRTYYFSVDGYTEKWYLEHLKDLINKSPEAAYKVKWKPEIKSPSSYAKTIISPYEVDAFHICDYESNESEHIKKFQNNLKSIKQAKKDNENILYKLGYSNYTFELWIILHKKILLKSLDDREKYLEEINSVYEESFQSLKEYKKEENFKRVLSKIEIEDVIRAIKNSSKIREEHRGLGDKPELYCGFEYYKDNPDLTINECVEKILKDCDLL